MSLPEEVVQIPITKLRAFPEHPFYVRDDDMMQQLVESVRQVGVLKLAEKKKEAQAISGDKHAPAKAAEHSL